MSFDDQYTAVIGDLLIERCRPAEDYALILSRTDDGPEAVLVAAIPDGAAYGVGEADGYARLFARAPTMLRLLREALTLFAAEFDGDEPINGGDLVDRFGEWRRSAIADLSAPLTVPAP